MALHWHELTSSERKLWIAFAAGKPFDLRDGDASLDNPEQEGAHWGEGRTVRSELIVQLLTQPGGATNPQQSLYLRGAKISGRLDLTGSTLSCPLNLVDCFFGDTIHLFQSEAHGISLNGSHVSTGLFAPQLHTRHNLTMRNCTCSGEVNLTGAYIEGEFNCENGTFRNLGGDAIFADAISVKQNVHLGGKFSALGTVRLVHAKVGRQLYCNGGQFISTAGYHSQQLSPGGVLVFADRNLEQLAEFAIMADGISIERDFLCGGEFRALGTVRLVGAQIAGRLICNGGTILHHEELLGRTGTALDADLIRADEAIHFDEGFSARGTVTLIGSRTRFMSFEGASLDANGTALELARAKIDGPLRFALSQKPTGSISLERVNTSALHDTKNSWPDVYLVSGLVYDSLPEETSGEIAKADWKWRKNWAALSDRGNYIPQTYNKIAAAYRSAGYGEIAHSILIAKQSARHKARKGLLGFLIRPWSWFLNGSIGYGYRPWRILYLFGPLLFAGSFIFNCLYRCGLIVPRFNHTAPVNLVDFHAHWYTLDLLLPVITLKQRDDWVAHGLASTFTIAFTIIGWLLTSTLVVGLTGFFKRD
ncbi:hypothetical protein OG754_23235 [Streptomyces decoyicus]|uniref:hypothetical protein n=1 Tax=Streptomyces decoyicus TaxID=249567 RepID=UPI002E318644|nr:hypothetical protein [Streptomyces decoyicus]